MPRSASYYTPGCEYRDGCADCRQRSRSSSARRDRPRRGTPRSARRSPPSEDSRRADAVHGRVGASRPRRDGATMMRSGAPQGRSKRALREGAAQRLAGPPRSSAGVRAGPVRSRAGMRMRPVPGAAKRVAERLGAGGDHPPGRGRPEVARDAAPASREGAGHQETPPSRAQGVFFTNSRGRRRSESNRRIEVLQTSALPLGYVAALYLVTGCQGAPLTGTWDCMPHMYPVATGPWSSEAIRQRPGAGMKSSISYR